jgi:ABC-2 type transport system permease protein
MKIAGVIVKSFREQIRSFWILLLSLSMGPFFILVYFLITESSKPQYNLLIVNKDTGISVNGTHHNDGKNLVKYFLAKNIDIGSIPFAVAEITDANTGIAKLKNKNADALIVIPESFSQSLNARRHHDSSAISGIEFTGDLTSANYLLSAVWANEMVNEFALETTNSKRIVEVSETALGISASIGSFDMLVPGILIVSLIMLMFTASIAFVAEVENKTILRLKLSRLSTLEFLGGIGFVQMMVGILSVILTLATAILLGFSYQGSLSVMVMIAGLTSISIIAFSLIIAAVTKSANEVLVVGNFPMFLFMFFTGAAFPLRSDALFTVAGYPVTIQGLMTPTHAISALNKTFIMNMDLRNILPEIIAIIALSVMYFIIGAFIFRQRHLGRY